MTHLDNTWRAECTITTTSHNKHVHYGSSLPKDDTSWQVYCRKMTHLDNTWRAECTITTTSHNKHVHYGSSLPKDDTSWQVYCRKMTHLDNTWRAESAQLQPRHTTNMYTMVAPCRKMTHLDRCIAERWHILTIHEEQRVHNYNHVTKQTCTLW